MDEIIPNLWLGDLESARDHALLRQHNITSILAALPGRPFMAFQDSQVKAFHRVPVDDTPDADILTHLLPSIEFLQRELANGRSVLVHCLVGMSRSPTIVAAYLMYTQHLGRDEALELIQAARPIISPSDTFLAQLTLFHQTYCQGSTAEQVHKPTRAFYLQRAVDNMTGNADGGLEDFLGYLRKEPVSAPAQGLIRGIRCKMCRRELATQEYMLDHGRLPLAPPPTNLEPSSALPPRDTGTSTTEFPAPSDATNGEAPEVLRPILRNSECSGYFVEPIKWMDPFLADGLLSGKIACPNSGCRAKLGNYNWAGMRCKCGSWVTPGFCIARSKVDEVG